MLKCLLMIANLLTPILNFFLNLIETIGYPGITLVSLLENVFTPIPSEAVIPFAGVLVMQGKLNLVLVIVSATLGSILGAFFFYYLGFILGSEKIRAWILKWGKYFFVTENDLDRAQTWFRKYDSWAVLICRIIPLVRSFISIPAGYVKMPLGQFIVLTAIGTSIWSTFLTSLGIIFGKTYTRFLPYFQKLDLLFGLSS
ncbi:MAG: DedA family protein [Candidatus Cloacimonetes bacterium]|nr:DedA family protein [Candidatus Cloacimonadota bacterium]